MEEHIVECPKCGFQNAHIVKCHLIRKDESGKIAGSMVAYMDGTRESVPAGFVVENGPVVKIYFEGECGHNWYIDFCEHKGTVRSGEMSLGPQNEKEEYQKYLNSPEWKALAKKKRKEADHKCQLCNNGGRLSVHHRTYEHIYNEKLSDLIALCDDCHAKFHDKQGG